MRCELCDSTDNLSEDHGSGGLNDACRGCFFVWYDGVGPCQRPEHAHQVMHVHGEDIRTFSLNAKIKGTWPYNGSQLPLPTDAEKARAIAAIAQPLEPKD